MLVALSAAYGAGGSRIGTALAERLGVPFLDRAIPTAVAERLSVPFDDALAHDEQTSTSWIERMLAGFLGSDTGAGAPMTAEIATGEDFRRATEQILRRQAETGKGVILGRGGSIVLRDDPRALRVRLHGPVHRRISQAMHFQGVDEATARDTIRRLDRTHAAYIKQFYGADIDDLSLYHLVIDSTAIPIETCVELIARASEPLHRGPGAPSNPA
jgi:cytidylate kinase